MARAEDGFFDDLARGLADGSITRGKALRLMGAAVVGSTLGSLGIGEASADPPGCKRNGKTCTRSEQCCSGSCASGSCQAQTTTTTTSTSTSTTSTSTTPGCLPNGGTCTADTQCCSGTICPSPNGKCCTPNWHSSNPTAGSCTADSECCSGICERGSATSGLCFSCRSYGGSCAAGEPCCSGEPCKNGTCCNSPGGGCNTDADCCYTTCRADGTCAPL
jgi:hypothetical protein